MTIPTNKTQNFFIFISPGYNLNLRKYFLTTSNPGEIFPSTPSMSHRQQIFAPTENFFQIFCLVNLSGPSPFKKIPRNLKIPVRFPVECGKMKRSYAREWVPSRRFTEGSPFSCGNLSSCPAWPWPAAWSVCWFGGFIWPMGLRRAPACPSPAPPVCGPWSLSRRRWRPRCWF